jgi:hypothetical protein
LKVTKSKQVEGNAHSRTGSTLESSGEALQNAKLEEKKKEY